MIGTINLNPRVGIRILYSLQKVFILFIYMLEKLKLLIRKNLLKEISIDSDFSMDDFKPEISKYEVINYDVWGNSDDGYEVNQAFHSGVFIEIPNEEHMDAKYVLGILRVEGILLSPIKDDDLIVDISHEDVIYFEKSEDGKPLFELRKVN